MAGASSPAQAVVYGCIQQNADIPVMRHDPASSPTEYDFRANPHGFLSKPTLNFCISL
ncbi:hypothetical protein D3C81_2306180 [compost metagenome]